MMSLRRNCGLARSAAAAIAATSLRTYGTPASTGGGCLRCLRAPSPSCLSCGATTATSTAPMVINAAATATAARFLTRKEIEDQLPDHIRVNPHDGKPSAAAFGAARQQRKQDLTGDSAMAIGGAGKNPTGGNAVEASREAEAAGINGLYGRRAENVMRGMLGPQGQADARETKALPILGRATVAGTEYTVNRSTVFENWCHRCADPVGWYLSKLGSATCKMPNDVNEAVESLQLQIIKGCNIFEIDGAAAEVHQSISRAIYETLEAFELDRSGFVMVVRAGVIKQPAFTDQITTMEATNTAPIRSRIVPIFERFKASSLPAAQLKSGFKISELTDEQLGRLSLRRINRTTAAGLSPEWLEAYLTNVAFNTRLECVDVFLMEAFHVIFDGRPDEHIDDEIISMFAFLETQVKAGTIQYYGLSSPHLCVPIKRDYPDMPQDAMVPEQFREGPKDVPVINLYRIMALAERAGGPGHHFRFVEYPFNLTAHQALSKPLPYDANHTLATLCKTLGITTMGYSPIETRNLMNLPERYHNFPMEADLKAVRMNFFTVCERAVLKEMEVKDSIEKGPATLPPLEHLFVASVFLGAQRQFVNLFFYTQWAQHHMMPKFRVAVMRFKEASSSDLKEWCKQYEQLIDDMLRLRRRMFEHKHGKKSALINMAIDHFSPTLARCPMLNQKALNFATYGCDVVLCGFHVSRYFHEATELNPAKNGELAVPQEEIAALCSAESVSHANTSPPHPYMLEPLMNQGRLSKQKSKGSATLVEIDTQNPKFPDIAEEIDQMDTADEAHFAKKHAKENVEQRPESTTATSTAAV